MALGCALGTRPLPLNDSWALEWDLHQSNGDIGLWNVGVVGYRSGRPAVGYLWRSVGKERTHRLTRVGIRYNGGRNSAIEVDGVAIKPSEDFQLFVNDLHNNPMRLVISRKQAIEVFGRKFDISRIEKFWNEVVEPQRHNPPAASAGGK